MNHSTSFDTLRSPHIIDAKVPAPHDHTVQKLRVGVVQSSVVVLADVVVR